jgi:hypothetical protein
MNAQPYTVVDCILHQGGCVFLMNQVDRAATQEWLQRFLSFRISNQDNIHTLRTSWALQDLLLGRALLLSQEAQLKGTMTWTLLGKFQDWVVQVE